MLKGLKARKIKFVLSSISIVLSVAFLMGTLILSTTLNAIFDDLFSSVYQSTDVVVRVPKNVKAAFGEGDITLTPPLTGEMIKKISEIKQVQELVPSVQMYATIIDKNNKVVGTVSNGPPTFGGEFIPKSKIDNFVLTRGDGSSYTRKQRDSFVLKDDEVIIDYNSFKKGKFKIGDAIKIQFSDGIKKFKLVAAVRFGKADSPGGTTLSLFNLKTAKTLAGLKDGANEVALKAKKGISQYQLKSIVKEKLKQYKVEVNTGKEMAALSANKLKKALSFFSIILGIFSTVAIVVAFFIINNSFSITIAQKLKELALLKSIGAIGTQIFKIVIFEALFMGTIASVVGIFGGIGLASFVKKLLGSAGFILPSSPLVVSKNSLLTAFFVGVVITLIASVSPAFKASRTNPLSLMREVAVEKTSRKVRTLIGLGIGIIGIILVFVGLSSSQIQILGLSIGLLFISSIVLLPSITGIVSEVFGSKLYAIFAGLIGLVMVIGSVVGIYSIIFGNQPVILLLLLVPALFFAIAIIFSSKPAFSILGDITVENIKKSPRRSAKTASALTIGVTLVAFIAVFASSAKVSLSSYIDDSLRADFYVRSKSQFVTISKDIEKKIYDVKGLMASTPVFFGSASISTNNQPNSSYIFASDYKETTKLFDLIQKGNLDNPNTVAISETQAKEKNLKLKDIVKIKFASGKEIDLPVGAIVKKDSVSPGLGYLIDSSLFKKYQLSTGPFFIILKVDQNVNKNVVRKHLETILKDQPIFALYDQTQVKAEQSKQIDQFLSLIYGLLALAIIIAGIGILNTLFLVVVERKRELGLLRAVGVTRDQLRQMLRWESTIISSLGSYIGIVLGTLFSWIMVLSLKEDGLSKFSLPFSTLLIIMALSITLGTAASIIPGWKASREDILDAISYE